jgi:hypothetical protein
MADPRVVVAVVTLVVLLAAPAGAWLPTPPTRDIAVELETGGVGVRTLAAPGLRPLALAAGDLDEDGVPDLVSTYGGGDGGLVVIHRGNVDALHPSTPEAQARRAAGTYRDGPFHAAAPGHGVPVAPHFAVVGDFEGRGHNGVLVATAGDRALCWLQGDGTGRLDAPRRVEVPGAVTALAAGDVNRRDGVLDLVVGVVGPQGPAVLVYESNRGALMARPEVIPVPGPVTALAVGWLDDDIYVDLAIGAGPTLFVVSGRDRRVAEGPTGRPPVPPPSVAALGLPAAVVGLAIGRFSGGEAREVAALLTDGTVHTVRVAAGAAGVAGGLVPSAVRASKGWKAAAQLVRAGMSTRPGDDLAVVDGSGRAVHVVGGPADAPVAIAAEGAPVAALAMRLTDSALEGLVVLRAGGATPLQGADPPAPKLVTVTSTGDELDGSLSDGACDIVDVTVKPPTGQCTLRAAVAQPVDQPGQPLKVVFAIPGVGPHRIVTSGIRACTTGRTVIVDGTNKAVELRHGATGFAGGGDGLDLDGDSCAVKGLTITGFTGAGIRLAGRGAHRVEGNFIGTDRNGTLGLGNKTGIDVETGGSTIGGTTVAPDGTIVERNVISGNSGNSPNGLGIRLRGDLNNVHGNFVGTDRTGLVRLPNSRNGISVTGGSNTIGGSPTNGGAQNVISGNDQDGISVVGTNLATPPSATLIQANLVGTTRDGKAALPNAGGGIFIQDSPRNIVGGALLGNVVSGNRRNGITITQPLSRDNTVDGNYIGVEFLPGPVDDITLGQHAIPNGQHGLDIDSASDNVIGTPGVGNVISGNDAIGLRIFLGYRNRVQDNFIGPDRRGTYRLLDRGHGNASQGILIWDGSRNLIGGTASDEGNIVAYNGRESLIPIGEGIVVSGGGTGNTILGNRIFRNRSLGIDLAHDWVTANDPQDPDPGDNDLQNFPVLTSAVVKAGTLTVGGTLNSTPGQSFRIELFGSPRCDDSGYGEGETFRGAVQVDTEALFGDTTFVFTEPGTAVKAGDVVTATATQITGGSPNPYGSTSEFSKCLRVTDGKVASARVGMLLRGTDNGIYHNRFDGAGWLGWAQLPGATADTPTVIANGAFLDLVVRGLDGSIYHNRFDWTTWRGWTQLPGATADVPALAATDDALHLVVHGIDGSIYHNRFDGAAWQGWTQLPGATADAPAAVANGAMLELVVRGIDGSIYHNRFDGAAWQGWTQLPGATADTPAVALGAQMLELVVRGIDGMLYHNRFDGTAWVGWTPIPGVGAAGTPALAVHGATLHLVTRGADGGIYHSRFAGFGWPGWVQLPGATLTTPALAVDRQDVLHLVVRGLDDTIYHNQWTDDTTGWRGFGTVGGAAASPAALVVE